MTPDPQGPRTGRTLRRALALTTAAALLGGGLAAGAAPASAVTPTVINSPPADGHSIIVFPDRDFIHSDGWAQGSVLTAEVIRNGVVVGTSDPITPIDDPGTPSYDGMFDLNHLGAPCWNTTTPDILPGDVLRVTDQNGVAQETPTANVLVTQKATAVGAGTVVEKGYAADAAGAQMAAGTFQARLIANRLLFDKSGKRDLRANPVYDGASNTWTATWTGLDQHDMDLVANSVASRVLWLGRAPLAATALGSPIESTIAEFGATGGAAAGCAAPQARYAVTTSTPAVLNIASRSTDLTVSGLSQNATAVSVTLTDSAGTTSAASAATLSATAANGTQTWTAVFPAAVHDALVDGVLTAKAVYTVPDLNGVPTAIGGTDKTIQKDTVAPTAPVATPPGGLYATSQAVSLTNDDGSPIFYTVAGATPTPASTRYSGQVLITADQTLRSVSQDQAGNLSPLASETYTFGVPTGAPVVGTATAGNTSATLSWTPGPANNFPVKSWTVEAFTAGSTTPAATANVLGATATTGTVTGLTNGTAYTLDVVATNAGGNSAPSARSAAVTPATTPGAPTIGPPTPGDSSATVTWSAPVDNGGSAVTGYSVQLVNGSTGATIGAPRTAAAGATSLLWTGLLNGSSYFWTVAAYNAVGTGGSSAPSATVVPAGLPGAPTGVTAMRGDGSVDVRWTAPASDGGSPITGYTITAFAGSTAGPTANVTGGASTSGTVTGLTNGTAYTFTVSAVTAVGTGTPSAVAGPVTPASAPAAPTAVTATAGDASAKVSWTAAASGGSAITGYTVQAFDTTGAQVGADVPATLTSVNVGGLTNGTAYTFKVTATNAVGSSAASLPSAAVTPKRAAAVPTAPTTVTGTAGNTSVTLKWLAPASDGGSAITGYSIRASTATGFVGTTLTSSAALTGTVTGLTNGTAYTFTVSAVNAVGTGTASAASAAITPVAPAGVPGAPTGVVATRGNASVKLTWVAPVSNGGSALTRYSIRAFSGATLVSTTPVATPVLTGTVTGLANGTAYTFDVAAGNVVGFGPASTPTAAVTPATMPGAPTGLAGTRANASVKLTWTAASNGGSAITGYSIRAFNSLGTLVSTTAVATPVTTGTVAGLMNGTAYTFDVSARNAVGLSVASARSLAVTPAPTAPLAPVIAVAAAGNGSARAAWTAASNGGSALTSYTVSVYTTNGTVLVRTITLVAPIATDLVVTGLTNGTAYGFRVKAVNAIGTSASSGLSAAVTPLATLPLSPVIGVATAGVVGDAAGVTATAAWTAPVGGPAVTGYEVTALKMSTTGTITARTVSAVQASTARSLRMVLAAGSYRFEVRAVDAAGKSTPSAKSNQVLAQ